MKKEIASTKIRVYPTSRPELKAFAGNFDTTIAHIVEAMIAMAKKEKTLSKYL